MLVARRKERTTSSQHVPYIQGNTHPTMGKTTGLRRGDLELILKLFLSSDCRLKFACMKSELVVIAGQKTAVNTFSLLVQRKYAPSAHVFELVKVQLGRVSDLKRNCSPSAVRLRTKGESSNFQFEVETALRMGDPAYKRGNQLTIIEYVVVCGLEMEIN